jgi:hypothetical protein
MTRAERSVDTTKSQAFTDRLVCVIGVPEIYPLLISVQMTLKCEPVQELSSDEWQQRIIFSFGDVDPVPRDEARGCLAVD